MSIALKCDCRKLYAVPDHFAGRRFRCKRCDEILTVPAEDEKEASPAARRRRRPRRSQRASAGVGSWLDEPDTPSSRPKKARRRRHDAHLDDLTPRGNGRRRTQMDDSDENAEHSSEEFTVLNRVTGELTRKTGGKGRTGKKSRNRNGSQERAGGKRHGHDTMRQNRRRKLLSDSDLDEPISPRTRKRRRQDGSDEVSDYSSDDTIRHEKRRARRRRKQLNDQPQRDAHRRNRQRRKDSDESGETSRPTSNKRGAAKHQRSRQEKAGHRAKGRDARRLAPRPRTDRGLSAAKKTAPDEATVERRRAMIVLGSCVGVLLVVVAVMFAMMTSGNSADEARARWENNLKEKLDQADAYILGGDAKSGLEALNAAIAASSKSEYLPSGEIDARVSAARTLVEMVTPIAAIMEAGGLRKAPDEDTRGAWLEQTVRATRSNRLGLRLAAVKILAAAEDPATTSTLLELARATEPQVANRAKLTLIKIGGPEALPFIADLISADGTAAQRLALESLVTIDDPEAVPLLADALAAFEASPTDAERILAQLRYFQDARALDAVRQFKASATGDLRDLAQEIIDLSTEAE